MTLAPVTGRWSLSVATRLQSPPSPSSTGSTHVATGSGHCPIRCGNIDMNISGGPFDAGMPSVRVDGRRSSEPPQQTLLALAEEQRPARPNPSG
ncbi:hypothetical protein CMUS01_06678 [Colletotrichum musicola]|uniref:Uncharacterized protein n=1 Tax=Colletotrichum musicola TaxID=2175873 RepID=A0A8H6KKD8_9PEZI|nr:hypothetical protein CMUS01_06678 [Colletotrichum musicola]